MQGLNYVKLILLSLLLGCSTQKDFYTVKDDSSLYYEGFYEIQHFLENSTSLRNPIVYPELEKEFYSIVFLDELYEEGLTKSDLEQIDMHLTPSKEEQDKFKSYLRKNRISADAVIFFTSIIDNRFFAEAIKYDKETPFYTLHSDTSYFFYFKVENNVIVEVNQNTLIHDY